MGEELTVGPSTVTNVVTGAPVVLTAQSGPQPIPTLEAGGITDFSVYETLLNRCAQLTLYRDGTAFNEQFPEAVQYSGTRIKFEVSRSQTSTPNSADIWVYNLSEASRREVERKPLSVKLDAGYNNVFHLLCQGDVHFAMSEQKGPDWITLLQVSDFGRAFSFARVNKSYGAGTTVRQVLKDVSSTMGLVLPPNLANDPSLDTAFIAGVVTYGDAQYELTKLLAPFGYRWNVQNGRLQVLRDTDTTANSAIPIDQSHGMVGTPQFGHPSRSGKAPHVTVKNFLYPGISPGNKVRLSSVALKNPGFFKVDKVKDYGDTHGRDWFTDLEILPV